MRRLNWSAQRPKPRHPYRDSALVYAGLAALVVIFAIVTGGSAVRAVIIAVFVFVVATAWGWWRWRQRLRETDE
jgi:membrane protein implicated in regulation of membrane protease activity